jgi:hypothetical protein
MNDSHSRIAVRNAALVLAQLLCACALITPHRVAGQVAAVARDEVRGTIAVHGYDLPANAFRVRARPVFVSTTPIDALEPSPPIPVGERAPRALSATENSQRDCVDQPVIVRATAVAGAGPARFEFSIRGLIPGIPYRIGVQLAHWGEGRAPRLVWSADRDPFVLPGGTELQFDAYAVRSKIEVMGPADPKAGRRQAHWVGAEGVDFTDPIRATRTFRWRTTLPDVTGGRLQVSVKPFPRIAQRTYSPCGGDDSGILYTQDFNVAAPGRWTTLPPLDFNALLSRSGRTGGDGAPPGTPGSAALDSNFETLILPKLEAGMPLYVRVLPMKGDEVVCDADAGGVPPEVLIALVKKAVEAIADAKVSVGTVTYFPPTWVDPPLPKPGATVYRILKDHKLPDYYPYGYSTWDTIALLYWGYGPGETIPEGKAFWYKPGSGGGGSWLEDFLEGVGSVLTGVVDAVGDLVNYASKVWEEIQDGVVGAVADSIDALGIVDCNEACRALLETGLEIGLASMGVPPSLPNFEELTNQGLEYLADQAAAQFAPGVPIPDFVKDYASQQAKDFVTEVAKEMKDNYGVSGLPDWLAPDIRFQPASLLVELYGPGKTQPFNSQPGIIRLHTPVYTGGFVKLPRHLPEKGVEPPLIFPMVLPANTEKLSAPPGNKNDYETAIWYWSHWLDVRYLPASACYHLHLTALSDPGGIYKIFDVAFRPTDGAPCNP